MGVGIEALKFGNGLKDGLSKFSCKVSFPVEEGLPIIPEKFWGKILIGELGILEGVIGLASCQEALKVGDVI